MEFLVYFTLSWSRISIAFPTPALIRSFSASRAVHTEFNRNPGRIVRECTLDCESQSQPPSSHPDQLTPPTTPVVGGCFIIGLAHVTMSAKYSVYVFKTS